MDSSKMITNSPEVLNFNRLFLKLNRLSSVTNRQFSLSSSPRAVLQIIT